MQYLPAAILWSLALVRIPHAKDARGRHVFWAALFAAVACTLYVPDVYFAVDTVLGGRNLVKLATLLSVMLGFWQFRSAILVAVSTDHTSSRRRLLAGRWAVAAAGTIAAVGFLTSNPGATSGNLQVAYADEPGMKAFLLSGSAFLVWCGLDLAVMCIRSWKHLHSPAFRIGFLLIAIGCAASCAAIIDRVAYGSISQGARPSTSLAAFLDSAYWPAEAVAVTCIGIGLIIPAVQNPARSVLQNLEARALLLQLRPAWLRATAGRRDIILNPSPFGMLTPFAPNAKMHLHRRYIEINDGVMRSGQSGLVLPSESTLLARAEQLLSGH
ncbi:MAB_1171c family putative transporter [Arthrobacter silviterrae]|uniref:MAB_1171c family putative transporter n=1 Tax=Arthrobacter silviterrae TaxID=2026658 RepID=UPI0027D8B5EC|nr:MAB_1171c family putative transporter [Arthrobacter silviterrae]